MDHILLFLVLGLGVGAVYAALTLGIVLTYQGTGMINFAAAAMAAVPMYVYEELEKKGLLTLPIPWLPSFEVGDLPTWLSVAIAVAVAGAIGAVTELTISRPLRKAPPLAKVVAAVGILLTLQAAVGLKYGSIPVLRTVPLPTGVTQLGGEPVAIDRLWLIGITVVLSLALALWFKKSRMGLAIQASAENERAAGFARLSPSVTGMVCWTVSSMFTALIMVLAGQATGTLSPQTMPLLVVPALAAALIARLSSLTIGLLGALALGVVQSELLFFSTSKDWWPEWGKQGIATVVPFVVIAVALFALGRAIPTRGDDVRSSLPVVVVPRNRPRVVAFFALAGLALLVLTSGTYRFGIITSLAVSLIVLSLVLLTGMVGQISLAQAAFAGIAGVVLSRLGDSVPFPFSLIIAALLAMVAGVLVGIPALRIRGAQLAVVTLAAALTIQDFVINNPRIVSATANLIPDPDLFGLDLAVRSGQNIARLPFGVMVLVIVVLSYVTVGNLMRARTGRTMLAIRSNERAAAAIGINVPRVKLGAFAVSSFLAGLGGGLIGYSRGVLSADSFGVFVGLSFLAVAYLTGITSVAGAMLAGMGTHLGFFYVFADKNLNLEGYYTLVMGISLLLTVVFNPQGVAGATRRDYERVRARIAPRKQLEKPPVAARAASSVPLPPRVIGEVKLATRGVTVRYGGVTAVLDVDIDVRAGEIVGLIGPNGAGKTSFVDALTGFTRCSGEVTLEGERLDGLSPYERARRGLVRTWQAGELFEDLNVADNVRVANETGNEIVGMLRDAIRPTRPAAPAVERALALLGLDDVADRKPSELSLGRQKSVGMARALAMEPRALLLDEPAAGLDSSESAAFGQQLRAMASTGVACLLIDHDMHLVMSVCDRVYVIEFGKQIASGTPEEVRTNPRVLESYLGSQSLEIEADAADLGNTKEGAAT